MFVVFSRCFHFIRIVFFLHHSIRMKTFMFYFSIAHWTLGFYEFFAHCSMFNTIHEIICVDSGDSKWTSNDSGNTQKFLNKKWKKKLHDFQIWFSLRIYVFGLYNTYTKYNSSMKIMEVWCKREAQKNDEIYGCIKICVTFTGFSCLLYISGSIVLRYLRPIVVDPVSIQPYWINFCSLFFFSFFKENIYEICEV